MTIHKRSSDLIFSAAALSGAVVLGCVFLAPSQARAACTQSGTSVDCTGVDGDGFLSTLSLNVRVRPDALVGNIFSTNVTGRCPLSLPSIAVGAASNVLNEGTISTFGVCGFGILAENGSVIANTGTILTHDLLSYGILTGDSVTVSNRGRISTDYQGSSGIAGGAHMRIVNEAGGTVITTGIGAQGIEVGASAAVMNDGAVATHGDASIGIAAAAGSALFNSGTVETSGNNSIGIQVTNANLTNTGRIRSVLSGAARALTPTIGVSVVGKDARFTNAVDGAVEATHVGVMLDGAQVAAITNAGLIDVSPARQADGTILADGATILARGTAVTEIANTGLIVARGGLPALRSLGPTVTLTNAGTIIGDVLLGAGNDVITYRAGSVINGTVDFGAGEDSLIFQGGGTFGTPILNAEFLSKSGAGPLVLTRDLAITRQVNIFDESGIVVNPGVRLTAAATGNLGLLRGAGTIDGAVTNSGILAPGTQNAKGTLTITGAFQQFADGTFLVRLSPDGSSDRLLIGGPAALAGALAVSYDGTTFRDGQRFDVISPISGSLSSLGQLTLIAPEFAFVKADLVKTSSGGLAVEIDRLSYSVVGATEAQRSIGRLLDRLQAAAPAALSSTLEQLEISAPGAATKILGNLAPESPGGVQNLGLLTLDRVAQVLRRGAASNTDADRLAWAQGLTSTGRTRGTAAIADFDLQGIIAGLDMAFGDVWLGLAAARIDGAFARGTNSASTDTSLIALTAAKRWREFAIKTSIAYGHGSPKTRRVRMQDGASDTLTGETSSNLWSATADARYEWALGPVTISPHLGATYHRATLGATDERRVLAVQTSHSALESLRPRAGAGVSSEVGRVRPYGDLSLSLELLQRAPRLSASLIGVSDSGFDLYGDARRRLAVEAEAGLAVKLATGVEGHVAAAMTANDLLAGRTLTAGITFRW